MVINKNLGNKLEKSKSWNDRKQQKQQQRKLHGDEAVQASELRSLKILVLKCKEMTTERPHYVMSLGHEPKIIQFAWFLNNFKIQLGPIRSVQESHSNKKYS